MSFEFCLRQQEGFEVDPLQLKMPGFGDLPDNIEEAACVQAPSADQKQLALEHSAAAFLRIASNAGTRETLVLIACCKQKLSSSARAEDMYTSPLFRQSIKLASRLKLQKEILSAKHGLLNIDQVISPYDMSLKDTASAYHENWSRGVLADLKNSYPMVEKIIVLAGSTYSKALIPELENNKIDVINPMFGLSMGWRLAFLKHCHRILDRKEAVSELYSQIDLISRHRGGVVSLSEALARPMPHQGVYFFFDLEEPTALSSTLPRLVRIGTHGVSEGSKATLRNRLRAHLGTSGGVGNHRSSVFRLHVGQAMIRRDGLQNDFPHWGKGQSTNADAALSERDLEQAVSRYMSKLQLAYIEVTDGASKSSLRAVLERNAIAAFTEHGSSLEQASSSWLGNWSAHKSIRETGLWNVRHIGDKANLENMTDIMHGKAPKLKKQPTAVRLISEQKSTFPQFPELLGN